MNDVSLNDIHRLKAILRAHDMHEEQCARSNRASSPSQAACDCFLAEDPFDMEKDPPARIEGFSNIAEQSRRHHYAGGRRRDWISRNRGPWEEVTP